MILTGCPTFSDSNNNGDAITISSVRLPNTVRDSDPITLALFAVEDGKEYLTASDTNGVIISASLMQGGTLTDVSITALQKSTVGTLTDVLIRFTPENGLPANNKL